jgi:lipopolysaccharide export system protein LptA
VRVSRAILIGAVVVLCALRLSVADAGDKTGDGVDIPIERTAGRLGLSVSRDAPMTIGSDELEVVRDETGLERVVFRRNVDVVQGDLRLNCDWLEAVYPDGAGGRPKRITARGVVRIVQADSEVRCTEAVFDDATCTAVCSSSSGPAELHRGENVIKGDEIVLNLCNGHLTVRGRARVHVKPEEEGS